MQMKRGNADLPVFTATSAIPFGPSVSGVGAGAGGKKEGVKNEDKEASIWDVPETPRK